MLGRSDQPTKPSEAIQLFMSINNISDDKIVEKVEETVSLKAS